MTTSIETDLKEVLGNIQKELKEIKDDLTDLKISQAEIRGDIRALDEKVTGLGKRLENQEFVNRSIFAALVILSDGHFWLKPKCREGSLKIKNLGKLENLQQFPAYDPDQNL